MRLREASSNLGDVGVEPHPSLARFIPRPQFVWAGADTLAALRDGALAERDRWALWLPVALAAGIGVYFALPDEPPLAFGAALGLAGLLLALTAAGTVGAPGRAILSLLAALLIGFGAAKFRTEWVAAPVIAHRIGPVGIDGRVESAEVHAEGMRMVLTELRIGRMKGERPPAGIRIAQRYGIELATPGSWVHITAVLQPPPAPTAPGDYDFARWAFYEQIGAVGYAYGKPRAIAPARPDTLGEALDARLQRIRNAITQHIRATIGGREGAIAAALITGERGAIGVDDQNAFRDSGLSHVLSISGVHLALAGGFFFWIVRALLALVPAIALRHPIKKWAAVAALAGATIYLLMSGFGPPAVRSYIMLAVMFIAILVDRPALSMRAVALAAGIILLAAPESLIEPGFEMSFAAVIGLIALAEWEQTRNARRKDGQPRSTLSRVLRYGIAIVLTSIVAGIASAPFAIYHFDRASQYGLLANLVAMPVVGFVIMPAATAAMVLMPFGLDWLPLVIMGKGVGLMLAIAEWVSAMPGAASVVPVWPVWSVVAVAFGGLWICLWRLPWRWLGLLPAAVGIAGAMLAHPPDLLVSRDARTVALRGQDGRLMFIRPSTDDYTAQNWLRRDGDDRDPAGAIGTPAYGVRCDASACIARAASGDLVAWVARDEALAEDCANATIVVSAVPTRGRCEGPRLVIDRFDVARNGAYAVTLGPELKIETSEALRGNRPWTQKPRRRARFNSGG